MITVYVLLSLKDNATYVGMASDASKRLKEHKSQEYNFKLHISALITIAITSKKIINKNDLFKIMQLY